MKKHNAVPKRILCVLLSALLTLAVPSCAVSGEQTPAPSGSGEQTGSSICFEEVADDSPYAVQEFEMTGVLEVFAKREEVEYAVASENFGVDEAVFEALFNLILYREKTVGDGYFDEFDGYFADGSLDPSGSVKSQKVPDGSGMYWYAECRNRALVACFDVLRYFEYARDNGVSPISRINEAKIREVMAMTSDGTFSGPVTRWFGKDATAGTLRAAAAIFAIWDDPSAFTARSDGDVYRYPEYDTDRDLLPEIADALGS